MDYESTPIPAADAPLNDMERTVLSYWEDARQDAFAPPWSRFRLDELPPQAVPWCSVVDVVKQPLDFVVRFWGSMRRDLYGQEITGLRVSLGDNHVSNAMFEQNAVVVRRKRPTYFRLVARREGGPWVNYGFLRLPISDDGEQVDKVFSISYYPELKNELHVLHGTLPPYGHTVIGKSPKSV